MCPKCPQHKCCMSLYCLPCVQDFKLVVKKEEDPNFECQMCKFDLKLETKHAVHRVFPVLYFIEQAIVPSIDVRFNDAENILNKMRVL